MRGQKGITLVALVITIIVMLILAGVTISVVINGGLFDQASNATEETKNGVIKDHITSAIATAQAEIYMPGFNKTAKVVASEIAAEINKAQAGAAAADGTDTNKVKVTFNQLKGYSTPATQTITVTPKTTDDPESTAIGLDVGSFTEGTKIPE